MPQHTFGIEIEFHCPKTRAEIAAAVQAAGVNCVDATYSHTTTPHWKVVSDGSLGLNGHELVSPVLADVDGIDTVCRTLSALGATVNRSCGLHVHVGARSLTVNAMKRLAALYAESEDVIDQLLPPSRRARNSNYARTLKDIDVPRLASARNATDIAAAVSRGERFSKLNYTAYWRHGTVEFRQHSGTVDAEKIKNWVALCVKLVETAIREESEALQVYAAPAAQPATTTPAAVTTNPWWRRGRRQRMAFSMLMRPEGVTVRELQVALNRNTRPSIIESLLRAREYGPCEWTTETRTSDVRRRGGPIYRLRSTAAAPATVASAIAAAIAAVQPPRLTPVPNLDALMTKLQMTPTERTYWVERQAMLSPTHE